MKTHYSFVFLFLSFFHGYSQSLVKDSLAGFDDSKAMMKIHASGFFGKDAKNILNEFKKDYLNQKYHLTQTNSHPISKYSSNTVANAPCLNEDFEATTPGTYTSGITGWTHSQGLNSFINSILCGTTGVVFSAATVPFNVYSTPLLDANCNNVSVSPFGGNNVVAVNKNTTLFKISRISQTFSVTNSNFVYNYAFKGALAYGSHACCEQPNLIFSFYDCFNNPISAYCDTIFSNDGTIICKPNIGWILNPFSFNYTPNWIVRTVNLAPYIGSCVRVEVMASACAGGSHSGYCYYDAKCSNEAIVANGQVYSGPGQSFTSCANTATLSGFPGFTSYSWQGPLTSGVSGSTNSVITTSVSGTYTLSAQIGTVSSVQTLSVLVSSSTSSLSIAGPTVYCTGTTLSIQAQGIGFGNYNWSTGSTLQAISANPLITTVYSVVATNTAGCISSATKTITVFQSPTVSITHSSQSGCIGTSFSLTATAGTIGSFFWSSGQLTPTITVSPSQSTIYSVSVTSSDGCVASIADTITVYQLPQFSINATKDTICTGQSAVLTLLGSGLSTYTWNTGANGQNIVGSPTINTVYTASVTNFFGCQASQNKQITVVSLPQIQIVASAVTLCLGESINLMVLGSNIGSILWNNASQSQSIAVSPTINTVYSVTVTSGSACIAVDSKSIQVNPLPFVQISVSSQSICLGDTVKLIANAGAINYLWNDGSNSATLSATPSVTSQYSVIVTDSNGCKATSGSTIEVLECETTGLKENLQGIYGVTVFPNPSSEFFIIQAQQKKNLQLINDLGQIIREPKLTDENKYHVKVSDLPKGIYFIRNQNASIRIIVK